MIDRARALRPFALLALVALCAGSARADAPDPAALIKAVTGGSDKPSRLEAAATLSTVARNNLEFLTAYLNREHKSSDAERRAVLATFGAAVPDKTGKFSTPGRKKADQQKREDELDWLAELLDGSSKDPATQEVIGDVAVIRALAASTDIHAAETILEFAFTEVGMVFRDECGRYLRKMSPYSLPAIIVASQKKKQDRSKARYANYQLERLDRQNAHKALDDANNELKVHILKAYADSQFREAVYAVLDHTDHGSPIVRKAARAAWMEYATGRNPPAAPKRKLVMPGGKLSDEEEPLWLNHRELANIEIRRKLEALTGEKADSADTLEKLSARLFAFYDSARQEQTAKDYQAGLAAAKNGKLDRAVELFDAILAQDPTFPGRDEMAAIYFEYGSTLQKKKEWSNAASIFAKAHALAPDGDQAQEALAAHHFSRGKALGETGDGSAEIDRARELDPTRGGAVGSGKNSSGSKLMLYGGAVWLVVGVILLIVGLALRRRR